MNKTCARCQKVVYPIEELKCLDKVSYIPYAYVDYLSYSNSIMFAVAPLSVLSRSFVHLLRAQERDG